jgi:hypothetical protein
MLINGFRVAMVKVQVHEKHNINLTFPVPFSILQELLDSALDILELTCFITKGNGNWSKSAQLATMHNAKDLVMMSMKLLDSLAGNEPYDLIDVAADNVRVSIRIR